jgi:putative Holliday junction resolvase
MSQSMLAFDFGLRHIGTAVGNLQSGLATALGHIDAQDNASRFAAIDALVSEWQPVQLVVGLPLALDGGEHSMTARARRFGRQLQARFALPVLFVDERLSSVEADRGLREAGRGGRKNKHLVHAESARIILQDYLDESSRR